MPYLQSIIQMNIKIQSISQSNTTESLTFSYGNINLKNGDKILPTVNTNNTTNDSSIGNTKPFDFDLFHRSAFRPQIVQTTTNEK